MLRAITSVALDLAYEHRFPVLLYSVPFDAK